MQELMHWSGGKVIIDKVGSQIYGILLPNQKVTHFDEENETSIRISHHQSNEVSEISLTDAKAIFFIKSFTGQSKHDDLHFYDNQAEVPFLWTRITFIDGEVIECLVPNSSEMVLSGGFFAWSVDPDSNNVAMYLMKKMIRDFQVLAVHQPHHHQLDSFLCSSKTESNS
jgi:hypothetical protein